ncbi:MAG: LTA synthase family protein [Brumimicrobium sp.]|nr:LTA synthase family protein [Brumimicrobium sp.]
MWEIIKKTFAGFALLLIFWILLFDFQRILFSIHYLDKLTENGFLAWLQVFTESVRLDISTAAFLSILPTFLILFSLLLQSKAMFKIFRTVLLLEVIVVALIHAGEINAYGEWNHKLTSRVFMHLSHPDEVFRTADLGMMFWFFVYLVLEFVFGWKVTRWMFSKDYFTQAPQPVKWKAVAAFFLLPAIFVSSMILARGGLQQIPVNIDSAYYSKNYVLNDISVNSPYFFGKSFLLYNRSEIDEMIPEMPEEEFDKYLAELKNYPRDHENFILTNKRPNIVMIILESWSATVSEKLNGKPGATPHFDSLCEKGLLFTNLYATASTSEIGNASIFSGYPALPEISIPMQTFKHRKLPTLNKDLKVYGYSSSYIFSGDLKYGNIQGYFMDHGFDDISDESDFPSGLQRGKLNYYDEDLYTIFFDRINSSKEPFLQCAFTGSTHSPFDFPYRENLPKWHGDEADFMNSVFYADECLNDFLQKCRQTEWFKNTLFVIVADHGHTSPYVSNPSSSDSYRIPLLIYGEPLKEEFRGKEIDAVGSQADIASTLLYQMQISNDEYIWSKDLLNPSAPQFALHTIIRGFGWVTPEGSFTYHGDYQDYVEKRYDEQTLEKQRKKCEAFMGALYRHYKKL